MRYTIGFKSGGRIEVEAVTGCEFASNLASTWNKNTNAMNCFHYEPGILICLTEVEFVIPSSLLLPPAQAGEGEKSGKPIHAVRVERHDTPDGPMHTQTEVEV